MPDFEPTRDRYGHVSNEQAWVVVGTTPAVTLKLAHRGFTYGTTRIEPNNFYFKHILLPSKSARTMDEKAENRLSHRHTEKKSGPDKAKNADAKGRQWAGNRVKYGAWPGLKDELGTDDAREHRKADNPSSRFGMSWADKYGSVRTPVNSAIVVSGVGASPWGTGSANPIAIETVATKIYEAVKDEIPSPAPAEPVHVAVTVDFGVACILEKAYAYDAGTSTFDAGNVATAPKSRMTVHAWVCGERVIDVYHCDGCA